MVLLERKRARDHHYLMVGLENPCITLPLRVNKPSVTCTHGLHSFCLSCIFFPYSMYTTLVKIDGECAAAARWIDFFLWACERSRHYFYVLRFLMNHETSISVVAVWRWRIDIIAIECTHCARAILNLLMMISILRRETFQS